VTVRDARSSPWSNKYDPPVAEGLVPPASLRELEVQANNVFLAYAQAYFTDPVTSVYFWDLAGGSFASCWLVKKELTGGRFVKEGSWDSIHVVEAKEASGEKGVFSYKATTTCMVSMTVESAELGSCNLSGSLIREKSSKGPLDEATGKTHIFHIGTLIESLENSMRESIEGVYLGKTNAVISAIHSVGGHGPKVNLLGLGSAKEKKK
jgi:capping protein beta